MVNNDGLIAAYILAENVMADEIWLKNGDRITGTVKKMEDKVLIFETPYAGEMSIKWDEITAVTPLRWCLMTILHFWEAWNPHQRGK